MSKQNTEISSVEDCLEAVVTWIELTMGQNFFIAPLEEFQLMYGKVNAEDEFYQSRMNYFLEYCVLERPMRQAKDGRSPVARFFEVNSNLTQGDSSVGRIWRDFCGFRHCLLQVTQAGDDQVKVTDLIIEKSLNLRPKGDETLRYLRKDSIFQGFIFGHHKEFVLGQGQIIHPEPANKQIHEFVKKQKRFPRFAIAEMMPMLAMANMRYLRMQHVNPAVIYQAISR